MLIEISSTVEDGIGTTLELKRIRLTEDEECVLVGIDHLWHSYQAFARAEAVKWCSSGHEEYGTSFTMTRPTILQSTYNHIRRCLEEFVPNGFEWMAIAIQETASDCGEPPSWFFNNHNCSLSRIIAEHSNK